MEHSELLNNQLIFKTQIYAYIHEERGMGLSRNPLPVSPQCIFYSVDIGLYDAFNIKIIKIKLGFAFSCKASDDV